MRAGAGEFRLGIAIPGRVYVDTVCTGRETAQVEGDEHAVIGLREFHRAGSGAIEHFHVRHRVRLLPCECGHRQ